MALDNFKQQFENTYETVFQKTLVSDKICSRRYESTLSYGDSVTRVSVDVSGIRVRDITIGVDRTIDSPTDSSESLTINIYKGTDFRISKKEMIQAGPLAPGEFIGGKVAKKVSQVLDAFVLYETVNAFARFDDGDLTTMASTGTPITLSSTTVPQLVTRAPAKLKRNHQELDNVAMVVDSYAAADLAQYILGKNIDLAGSVFKNGYSGSIANADVYVSENLTQTVIITYTGQPSNGETFVYGDITFTAVSSIGSTPGNFLIGVDQDTTYTNLVGLITAPGTTSATQVALSAANQIKITDVGDPGQYGMTAAVNTTTNKVTLTCKGAGRQAYTEGLANATTVSYLNCYFGRKGAIDLVVQDNLKAEMIPDPYQRATIIRGDLIAGIKTFADGAQQFLDLLILV